MDDISPLPGSPDEHIENRKEALKAVASISAFAEKTAEALETADKAAVLGHISDLMASVMHLLWVYLTLPHPFEWCCTKDDGTRKLMTIFKSYKSTKAKHESTTDIESGEDDDIVL